MNSLLFRASISTGFLPPSLNELPPSTSTLLAFQASRIADPLRPGESLADTGAPIQLTGGGNPQLSPEESESWSIGLVLTPRFLDGLRASIDYVRITKSDEITQVLNAFNILDFESTFPGRVSRGPLSPEDIALGYTGGPVVALDTSLLNVARSEVDAYDLQINYKYETNDLGDFELYAVATYQQTFEQQVLENSPAVDRVGFLDGPLKWRANVGMNWRRGGWKAGWNAQYYDSYSVHTSSASTPTIEDEVRRQGAATIPSQLYHDVFLQYEFGRDQAHHKRFPSEAYIRVGILNLLDELPPIIQTVGAGNGYSTYGDPRLRRFSIQFTMIL